MLIRLAAAAALLLASPVFAQSTVRATPPDSYKFLSAGEIDKEISKPEAGRVYGALVINDHENFYVEFVKRLDHGNLVERHGHWIDQITILAGEGVVTYGGTLTDAKQITPDEVRGGTQTGAMTKTLHAGDFVLIPAGLPHKFDAAPGKTLSYVVYKARS